MAARLESAYLLLGNDRTRIATALLRMRKHFDDDAVETHQALAASGQEIVEACMMLGLFASRRLIVVHGVDAWKVNDVDALLSYLDAPSPDAVLLLTAGKLAANSRLRKAFAKPRLVDCAGPEKPTDVAKWVVKTFAAEGAAVPPAVAQRLVAIAGHVSLDRLATEIARIVAYADDEPVTAAMVELLATPHAEAKVWALTDAWASRDRSAFLAMIEQLLAQREHPVRLTGIVGNHLRLVHQARRLLDTVSLSQAGAQLVSAGTNQWAARKAVDQAQRISMPQADAALARVALLDAELKGASALSSGKVAGERDASVIVFERGMLELV